MNINNPTHASALDLHDQLHAIMDRLEPVMIELASRPGIVGDGVAENEIVMQLDHAIESLWSYLQHPKRRQSFRIPPVPPGMDKLERDPHFPMAQFKRLLVRFIHAAFDDDQLNEYQDHIAIYIGDGEGSGLHEEVVYWNNGDGSRQEAIATGHGDDREDDEMPSLDIELPPPEPQPTPGRRKAAGKGQKPSGNGKG